MEQQHGADAMFRELAMRKMEEQENRVKALEEMMARLPKALARSVREELGPQPDHRDINKLSYELLLMRDVMTKVLAHRPVLRHRLTVTFWAWIILVVVAAVAIGIAVRGCRY